MHLPSGDGIDGENNSTHRIVLFRITGQLLVCIPSAIVLPGCDDPVDVAASSVQSVERADMFVTDDSSDVDGSSYTDDGVSVIGTPVWTLTASEVSDAVMASLVPVSEFAELTSTLDDDASHHRVSEEDAAYWLQDALEDDFWYDAETGHRYSAMLVLGDGTAFGQLGSSPEFPEPSEENGFGGSDVFLDDPRVADAINRLHAAEAGEFAPGTGYLQVAPTGPEPSPILHCGDISCDRRDRMVAAIHAPWYRIGALNGSTIAGKTGCTGAKVGPRAVLTNSHCVLKDDGWVLNGYFHPGQDYGNHLHAGGTAVPWSGVFARDWRTHRKFDYAIVYLEDRQSAVNLGWFGITWCNSGAEYDGKSVYGAGYPGEMELCAASPFESKECKGDMYYDLDYLGSSDYRSNGRDDENLAYDLDAQPGHSGQPIFRTTNNAILAVHWGGFSDVDDRYFGARFRWSMYNDVCNWIAAVSSNHGTHPNCN